MKTYIHQRNLQLCERISHIPSKIHSLLVKDDTGIKLAHFIQNTIHIALPKQSFSSIYEDSAQAFIHSSSIFATNFFSLSPDYGNPYPQLEPIEQLTDGSSVIYFKEHVEQTAKMLFGYDITINHSNALGAIYNDLGGIYYLAFWGMEVGQHTVLFSYQEYEEYYEVHAVFPSYTDHHFMFTRIKKI